MSTKNPSNSGAYKVAPTNSNKSVLTSSTEILAANANRKYVCLVNSGSFPVYLGIGATAVADKGVYIAPLGGSYEMISGESLYLGAINGISVGGASNVTIIEAE